MSAQRKVPGSAQKSRLMEMLELERKRAKLQRKLAGAQKHLENCSDPVKRQLMESNCTALERELRLLAGGAEAQEERAAAAAAATAAAAAAAAAAQAPSAASVHGIPEPCVVTGAADSAVDTYRDLKDDKAASRKGLCIVEGPESIRMLLRSELEVASLFVKPTIFDKLAGDLAERQRRTGRPISVMTAPHQLMGEVVGYSLNRGALAAATVPTGRDMPWLRCA
jgi:hypothetical protein